MRSAPAALVALDLASRRGDRASAEVPVIGGMNAPRASGPMSPR